MKPKRILLQVLINSGAILAASRLIPGLAISGDYKIFFTAGACLTAMNFLIKPFLKLLFLPINILTLGLLRWLINVIILYLLTLVIAQIKVTSFSFSGFSYNGFVLPSFFLPVFASYIICSFTISFIGSLINWLVN